VHVVPFVHCIVVTGFASELGRPSASPGGPSIVPAGASIALAGASIALLPFASVDASTLPLLSPPHAESANTSVIETTMEKLRMKTSARSVRPASREVTEIDGAAVRCSSLFQRCSR
jgi:hypothetical protein